MSEEQKRFRKLIPVHVLKDLKVAVVGCGALGSHLAPGLARYGCTDMTLIDPDTVETVNLGYQNYYTTEAGMQKARVSATHCELATTAKTRPTITVDSVDIEKHHDLDKYDFVFSAVDSEQARRDIMTAFLRSTPPEDEIRVLIDGRMDASGGDVFVLPNPAPAYIRERYMSSLELGGVRVPCGEVSSPEGVLMTVGLMMLTFRRFCTAHDHIPTTIIYTLDPEPDFSIVSIISADKLLKSEKV